MNSAIGNVLWVEDGNSIVGYANKISSTNNGSIVDAYNETWPSDAPKRGYAIIFSIFSDATSADNYVHFMSQGKVKTAQASDDVNAGKGLTILYYLPETAKAGQTVTGTFTYTIDGSSANPESLTDAKTIEYSVELIDVVVKTGEGLLGTEAAGKYAVTLDKDYVLSSYMEVPNGKELALNLNGHKLYANGTAVTTATKGVATVSINGEKSGSSIIAANYPVFFDYGSGNSKLTVTGGTYTGSYGMVFYANSGATNVTCSFDGIIVDARDAGLWLSNGPIDSGAIKNCQIAAGGTGVYAGTVKSLTIENTDIAAGETGVEIKTGEVAIKGGSIYSEAFDDSDTQINNNGSGAGVDALVINNGYTGITSASSVSVKVEGTAITNGESNTPVLIIAGMLNGQKTASAVPISFETDSQTIDQIAVKKCTNGAEVNVKTKGGQSVADATKVNDLLEDKEISEVSLIVTEDQSNLDLKVPAGKKLVINAAIDGAKLNGKITTGAGSSAQVIELKDVIGTFMITKGSIVLSDADISAGSITLDNSSAKVELVIATDAVLGNFSINLANPNGKEAKVTIPEGVTVDASDLSIAKGITTYVSGKIGGTVNNNGKLVLLAGGDISDATIIGSGSVVNGGEDSAYSSIDVNGSIKTPSFGPEQLVRINGEATVSNTVVFNGKLIVPEGSKLTVKAGATVIMDNLAIMQIDGELVVEGADGTAPAGQVVLRTGSMLVNSSTVIDGKLQVEKEGAIAGTVTVSGDAVLTMNDESVLATADGTSITVKKSGALEILGAFDGVVISNSGQVTIDSDYAATQQSTVKLKADGAVLDVKKYTVSAVAAGTAKIIVDDNNNTLATYKVGGETKYVTLSGQTASVEISASGIADADYTMSVSGITIAEVVTSEAVDSFVNSDVNAKAGRYNNKQMSQALDINGSMDVSYAYIGSATAAEKTAKAKIAVASAGSATENNKSITVSGAVTLGDNVELVSDAELSVTGKITAPKSSASEGFHAIGGEVTVAGEGEASVAGSAFSTESFVNATKYVTEAVDSANKKVKTYHYVALDAALTMVNASGSTVKDLAALGTQTITANATLPAAVTLTQDSGAVIIVGEKSGDDVTLTIAKGAVLKNNGEVLVNGIVYAEDKSDVKTPVNIKSDVYSEQLGADGKVVKNGWAKWTNLVTAVNGAASGETITASNTTDIIDINSNMTVRDGVTLVLPEGTLGIKLADGVTLTIEGTVIVSSGADIKAQTGFDLTASKVEGTASNGKYSSAVIVTGKLMTEAKVGYGNGVTKATSGAAGSEASLSARTGAPIAGAYYQTDDYYVISSLEKALADSSDMIVSEVRIYGKVVAGDVVAKGTDTLKTIALDSSAARTGTDGRISESGTLIGTALTVGSITLDGMSLHVGCASENPAYFTGSVVIGDAVVAFKHATGIDGSLMVSIDDGKFILGGVNVMEKDDSVAISAGTVYAGKAGAGGIACNVTGAGAAKVAEGATLVANATGIQLAKLTVNGTLSVPANMQMAVNGTLQVNGAVAVDAATSTSAKGELTVGNTTAVGKLFIGISASDYKSSTGAAASFSGPVTVDGQIIVAADAAIDDAFKAVIDEIDDKTTFNVSGSAWFTAYFVGTAGTRDKITVNKIAVPDVELLGWADKNGTQVVPSTGSNPWEFTIGEKDNLYAMIDTQVYRVVVKADEGVDNVYLNGQAMSYGLIADTDFGGAYYAYFANVAAGSYKVTYTLKNGYSGEAKLAGDNVSGMSFSVSGDYSKEKVYQLSGIEKSGYVDPTPVTPSEKDDGMTITDYLLIVLVVLIVIMAVIVAMRLMRS